MPLIAEDPNVLGAYLISKTPSEFLGTEGSIYVGVTLSKTRVRDKDVITAYVRTSVPITSLSRIIPSVSPPDTNIVFGPVTGAGQDFSFTITIGDNTAKLGSDSPSMFELVSKLMLQVDDDAFMNETAVGGGTDTDKLRSDSYGMSEVTNKIMVQFDNAAMSEVASIIDQGTLRLGFDTLAMSELVNKFMLQVDNLAMSEYQL